MRVCDKPGCRERVIPSYTQCLTLMRSDSQFDGDVEVKVTVETKIDLCPEHWGEVVMMALASVGITPSKEVRQ